MSQALPAFGSAEWKQAAKSLYRQILKLHQQKLLAVQRELGDKYVKAEFKLHKKASKDHAVKFMKEWQNYASIVAMAPNPARVGRDLSTEVELNEQQQEQLEKLKQEALEVRKTLERDLESQEVLHDLKI